MDNPSQSTVPVENKALENGLNSSTYRDDIYSLKAVPVIFDEIEKLQLGKKEKKLYIDRAKAVREATQRISKLTGNGASVEWIGTKIQKTPGIMREAGFVFHHDLKIEKFGFERDIIKEDLQKFFRNHIVEGLVIRHPRLVWMHFQNDADWFAPSANHISVRELTTNQRSSLKH